MCHFTSLGLSFLIWKTRELGQLISKVIFQLYTSDPMISPGQQGSSDLFSLVQGDCLHGPASPESLRYRSLFAIFSRVLLISKITTGAFQKTDQQGGEWAWSFRKGNLCPHKSVPTMKWKWILWRQRYTAVVYTCKQPEKRDPESRFLSERDSSSWDIDRPIPCKSTQQRYTGTWLLGLRK